MSYTPFNAPLLSDLLGDREIAAQFSVKADIHAMLEFESALAKAQSAQGLIPNDASALIVEACDNFEPDMQALQDAVATDGMAAPEFVRQLRASCAEDAKDYLHFGSTSQDVVDTSLTLRLKNVNAVLRAGLQRVISALQAMLDKHGNRELMGRTRMQAALPVTVARRVTQWVQPLQSRLRELETIAISVEAIQLGGPVGTLGKMKDRGDVVRKQMADQLGLSDPGNCWHTDRARLLNYCNWLSMTSSSFGKLGQDFALMAQNELAEVSFASAGSSSAMAHKQNPVKAEILVTLAKFAASLNSGMQQSAVHEQERSGVNWTLEWMLVPQLCVATGAGLNNAERLISSVTNLGNSK